VNQPVETDAARQAAKKARDGRNLALALGLVAFVVLVFVVTLVRLGGNVAHPHV
jgi:t-SNARE complex subunit (syntaxin)